MWRDLAIAVSLANLCYFRVWSELLSYTKGDTFWMKLPPRPTDYAAVMLNVILLGVLLWAAAGLVRRSGRAVLSGVGRWTFVLLFLLPLNGLREVLGKRIPYLKSDLFGLLGRTGVVLVGVGLGVVTLFILLRWNRQLPRACSALLLILFPLVPINLAQAVWKTATYDPRPFADKPLLPHLSDPQGTKPPRVLWIILDELDYRLTFVDRDSTLRLPEIDRFRREALFASRAYPPGPGTPISIPAYFTGKLVDQVRELGPDELLIRYRGSNQAVRWDDQPNLFSQAHQAGFRTALVGWFHPYCRVLNSSLNACWWYEMAMQHNSMGDTFWESLPNQTRSLFETTLLSVFGQSLSVHQQIRTYSAILEHAKKVAGDPEFDLSFVHFPVPHAPHAYDRSTGQFTLKNSPIRGYVDSLELADRTLGDLRRSMESAGTWEGTTILVSSDHPYREAMALDGKMDPRIPFLLKLAGQKEGVTFDQAFNAVVTQDLLLSILRGGLSRPEDVVAWLNRHAPRSKLRQPPDWRHGNESDLEVSASRGSKKREGTTTHFR